MNIANKITVLRIVLTFIFMVFLSHPKWGFWTSSLSLVIFIIAALSDFLDGRIAKKKNMVTDFGKLMDPIADKILVLSAFIAFIQMGFVQGWMVAVIILRELLITSLRVLALGKGRVLAAGKIGKHKTLSQMVVIFLILGFIVFKDLSLAFSTWNPDWQDKFFRPGIDTLMWFIVGLTVYSGFSYLWENRKIIANI